VKQVIANHRLILTGTPIQNNVVELWSLFDFLMPGFLGTEIEFNKLYTKPILASREAKSNSKEQENGTLAMEALHRQVLPFLLRRVKEDVLKDLPEKIIQDYYVDMCPLQVMLYEDFSKEEDETIKLAEKEKSQHVFQQLNYARKLCDHPLLVVNPKHTKYEQIQKMLEKDEKTLHDISYSPKLQALSQLLKDSTEAEHRILIFCQFKSMLDIIENDLLKEHLKEITYMRLDGSVESNKRHEIVTKFNADPTIDCLLLTTRVGGLGLNLTGADTVIFVEHDWNPSMDLQAMDRTHRIGQTKCVNVYRLITRNTIEEKIMSLQKFKLNISQSVVNRENSSFKSMDTDKLLNMFEKAPEQKTKNEDELWDENQYNEFDMSSYLKSNQ
jgi:TATA-binding protein-associated factor